MQDIVTKYKGIIFTKEERSPKAMSARRAQLSRSSNNKVAPPPPPPLADWRIRVHAARRRVMIIIITAQRLRRGLRHPNRLPRLDDMGWFIPCGLGDDREVFMKELLKYLATREQVRQQISSMSLNLNLFPIAKPSWFHHLHRSILCKGPSTNAFRPT